MSTYATMIVLLSAAVIDYVNVDIELVYMGPHINIR